MRAIGNIDKRMFVSYLISEHDETGTKYGLFNFWLQIYKLNIRQEMCKIWQLTAKMRQSF